jgi:predicted dehydrogenase
MGAVHARGWRENAPRGEIVAIADVSADRARHISETYTGGRAAVYPDLAALLADPAVAAVDICLPHHLHTEAILAAAAAGKAILCEKPICTTLEDAVRLGDALRAAGVIFMAAHNQLFQPSLIEARQLLDEGAIGRPFLIRSIEVGRNRGFQTGRPPVELGAGESPYAWRADPARMGGGEVLDTGWHGAYRLLALAGERPVAVSAMLGRYVIEQVPDDTGLLLVRFGSGLLGEIVTSWAFGLVGGWQFEVAGEHGVLAGGGGRIVHQLHGWPQPAERAVEPVHTYTAEITHFLDVVQRGAPNPATYEHAVRVLQLITAAYQAAATGRTVELPEEPTELDA